MCLRAQFSCAAELCIIICAGHESMGQIERGANVRTALYYYAVWAAKTIIMSRDTYECVCVLCIDTFLLMPFAWLCVIIGQEFGERVVTFCIKCVIQMRCIIMAHQFNFAPVVGIESTKTFHYMRVNVKKKLNSNATQCIFSSKWTRPQKHDNMWSVIAGGCTL